MQVAIILMNLLAGPPLFRAAVIASGEARFGVGRAESQGEAGGKDYDRASHDGFEHRPPCAPAATLACLSFCLLVWKGLLCTWLHTAGWQLALRDQL